MDNVDIIIIGAGVVGLSIASELSEKYKNVIVLEKYDRFGLETSSRNSEVIHGGMYYPVGTLKANFCVEGRNLLYELCRKKNIPHKKIGKLIVATEREEVSVLEKLFDQGIKNGVSGLKIIDKKEISDLEPNIAGIAALHSPETGIVDSHYLMQYFADNVNINGSIIAYNSEVIAIEKVNGKYKVSVKNGNEIMSLEASIFINSAGLDSDTIAQMVGLDTKKNKYELHYCKGQYFRANGNKIGLIKRLVYPVPKPKSAGLGIHATLDLSGGLRLGPDEEYLNNRVKDYSVDNSKKTAFCDSAKKFMPFIQECDILPDTAGIRPKLMDADKNFCDFIIKEESEYGFERFINLIGIESPGLTACLSISRNIQDIVEKSI